MRVKRTPKEKMLIKKAYEDIEALYKGEQHKRKHFCHACRRFHNRFLEKKR